MPPPWAPLHPPQLVLRLRLRGQIAGSDSPPVARQTQVVSALHLRSKPADPRTVRSATSCNVQVRLAAVDSAGGVRRPAASAHPPAASVGHVPESANVELLPAIHHLEERLSASRPRCALTIDAVAVSFSDQYFFFVFGADSCIPRYPLQLGYIDAVEHHG